MQLELYVIRIHSRHYAVGHTVGLYAFGLHAIRDYAVEIESSWNLSQTLCT
jgi:hypothetical protein